MSAELDPRDDLTDRLRALGQRAVDPALQSEHLTALAGVRSGSAFRTSLAGRLKVGAGVLAGFLLGATGLTTAGAMGPLQPIAARTVEAVAPVDVPKGKADQAKENAEKEAKANRLADGSIGTQRIWDGCEPGEDGKTFAGNRGQYLKQERAKGAAALQAAKDSDCGKPVADDEDGDTDELESTEAPEVEGDENGKADEDHGKATAPGQDKAKDAAKDKGQDKDKASKPADEDDDADADEAGKPATPGNSAGAGQPDTTPATPDVADDDADHADDNAPQHTPGTPAEPTNGNGGGKTDTQV